MIVISNPWLGCFGAPEQGDRPPVIGGVLLWPSNASEACRSPLASERLRVIVTNSHPGVKQFSQNS